MMLFKIIAVVTIIMQQQTLLLIPSSSLLSGDNPFRSFPSDMVQFPHVTCCYLDHVSTHHATSVNSYYKMDRYRTNLVLFGIFYSFDLPKSLFP